MENTREPVKVNDDSVRSWLESMRAADARIQREKARSLPKMTPQESLRIYLELWQTAQAHFDTQRPSEYLMRLQQVYRRVLEARKRDHSARSSD